MKLMEIIGWVMYVPIIIAFMMPTIWLLWACWPLTVVIIMGVIGFFGAHLIDKARKERNDEI